MGTSTAGGTTTPQYRDHPHACGDKNKKKDYKRECRGSSPRVWGQANPTNLKDIADRIIPTRVGTSLSPPRFPRTLQDHPHACGDKTRYPQQQAQQLGSSPRVWGQDFFGNVFINPVRIIPTRVGTSYNVTTDSFGN